MNECETFPLTQRQKVVLFSNSLNPETPVFHLLFSHRFFTALDVQRFQSAFERVVQNTDALRATIEPDGVGGYCARIRAEVPAGIDYQDLTRYSNPEKALRNCLEVEGWSAFDLSQSAYASWLFKLDNEKYVWAFKVHHAVFDGVSAQLMFRRLEAFYQGSDLVPEQSSFGEYAQVRSRVEEKDAAFWNSRISSPGQSFSFYGERPEGQMFEVESFDYALPEKVSAGIDRLAEQIHSAELSITARKCSVLASVLGCYLSKAGSPGPAEFALTHHGRLNPADWKIIGLFTQVLPLSFDVDSGGDFRSLVASVQVQLQETLDHADFTFANPVKERRLQVGLNHRARKYGLFSGKEVETHWLDSGWSEFALSLDVIETSGGFLHLVMKIDKKLLDESCRRAAASAFFNLLVDTVSVPEQPLKEHSLLTDQDRHLMRVKWNDTACGYPDDRSLQQLFEQQVVRTPESIAIIADGDRVSYRTLNEQANRLAHRLFNKGVSRGDLVGLMMSRSVQMVEGLLAILKAGGAYLPLDPCYPLSRNKSLLEDAAVRWLIKSGPVAGSILNLPGLVVLDLDTQDFSQEKTENLQLPSTPDDLASCLFTSGSTGTAKGVLSTHRGMVNVVSWLNGQFPFERGEVACLKTTFTFVDFAWELFSPLLAGVPSVLLPELMVRDTRQLSTFLDKNKVSRLVAVPSLLNSLMEQATDLTHLKLCIVSGEPLAKQLSDRFQTCFPGARLVNAYGSTESSAITTFWECEALEDVPSIGRPIANTFVRILDLDQQPVPIGVWGELCVGGVGLAREYLANPELTEKSFIPDPVSGHGRLYKTGDLARYGSDGLIECRGRIDRQVKIRGFRIEPGEIETSLGQHADLRASRVEAVELGEGTIQLIAWCVSDSQKNLTADSLRHYLGERLPSHMVPAHLFLVPELPLTDRGKVDRAAFLAQQSLIDVGLNRNPEKMSEVETVIVDCWKRLIPGVTMGPESDFFDVGGDSLLAAQAMVELEHKLERSIPLGIMIKASTPRSLAAFLDRSTHDDGVCSAIEFSKGEGDTVLFLTPNIGGVLFRYRNLLKYLPSGLGVTGLQFNNTKREAENDLTIETIAVKLHDTVKLRQPHGPYLLAGFCFGGVLALELARLLEQNGDQVAFLGLVESWAPGFKDKGRDAHRAHQYARANLLNRLHYQYQLVTALRGKDQFRHIYRVVNRKARKAFGLNAPAKSTRARDVWAELQRLNLNALKQYEPQRYSGDVTIFRAFHSWRWEKERDLGWSAWLSRQAVIADVPGFHGHILEEPFVKHLGKHFVEALDGKW